MIKTLYEIGKVLSEADYNRMNDVIDNPKFDFKDKKGNELKYYIAPLVFDFDQNDVYWSNDIVEFDAEKSAMDFYNLKVKGGNNSAFYFCAEPKKFNQIYKTLFGKEEPKTEAEKHSDFVKIINENIFELVNSEIYNLTKEAESLKEKFFVLLNDDSNKINIVSSLNKKYGASKFALVYVAFKKESSEIKPFFEIDGYQQFIEKKFFENKNENASVDSDKLCYVKNEFCNDVNVAEFGLRYNLNKIFVETTIHYANDIDKRNFGKNYNLSAESIKFMERASTFLLKEMVTKIADVTHVIIPEFRTSIHANYKKVFQTMRRDSDIAFHPTTFEEFTDRIESRIKEIREGKDIYWLNFFAIESDGNFLKFTQQIKHVSQPYFIDVFETFVKSGLNFQKWIGSKYIFNISNIYFLFPYKKDAAKTNEALKITASILEGKKINKDILIKNYINLVLCHVYNRHKAYSNVREKDKTDYALKEATYSYLALFNALTNLNLLKEELFMENNEELDLNKVTEEMTYGEKVELFFEKMGYTDSQKALFYLGRALNMIGNAQAAKSHDTKPVMNKLNYSGMNKEQIIRLRNELSDKARQYQLIDKMNFSLGKFTKLFDVNNWKMSSQEALFFILSGYSY